MGVYARVTDRRRCIAADPVGMPEAGVAADCRAPIVPDETHLVHLEGVEDADQNRPRAGRFRGLDLATPRGGASSPARHMETKADPSKGRPRRSHSRVRVGRVTPTIVLDPFRHHEWDLAADVWHVTEPGGDRQDVEVTGPDRLVAHSLDRSVLICVLPWRPERHSGEGSLSATALHLAPGLVGSPLLRQGLHLSAVPKTAATILPDRIGSRLPR
jgi:hypothetical protein